MEVITDTIADKAYMSGYDEGYAAGIRRTLEAAAKTLSKEFKKPMAKDLFIKICREAGFSIHDGGDVILIFDQSDENGFAPQIAQVNLEVTNE